MTQWFDVQWLQGNAAWLPVALGLAALAIWAQKLGVMAPVPVPVKRRRQRR